MGSGRVSDPEKKKKTLDSMIALWHKFQGSHAAIARELGCTKEWVRQNLNPAGFPASGGRSMDELVIKADQIKEAIKSGLGVSEIRLGMKLSAQSWRHICGKFGIDTRPARRRFQTEKMVEAYQQAGGNYGEAAKLLGTSQTVYRRAMKHRNLVQGFPNIKKKTGRKKEVLP